MSKKHAYVTFIMRNDSFVPGALVLGYSLLKQQTKADLVCLVTKDISQRSIKCLQDIYTHVVLIDEIIINHQNNDGRNDRSSLFTRFQALRLGIDGDLGFEYDKIVLLDADILTLRNYDHLFKMNTPAGIINESKSHWYSDFSDQQGRTIWHTLYEDICPHGKKIPQEITDRVWNNSANMGINACLWVLEPSMLEYKRLMSWITLPDVIDKIQTFNWPEMQFATYFWSNQWYSVDIRFCAYNAQPNINSIYGTHYAGFKPWQIKKEKVLQRYLKYDDYQLWYATLIEMLQEGFQNISTSSKLKRLCDAYHRHMAFI